MTQIKDLEVDIIGHDNVDLAKQQYDTKGEKRQEWSVMLLKLFADCMEKIAGDERLIVKEAGRKDE